MKDAVIIGSGFSGLGMAAALEREGKRYVVLEKGDGVGGTWRENRYPGCACDVPSHLYSFSFAPNPNWSHHYAPQKEILAYLQRTSVELGIQPHVRFGQEVERAEWDERRAAWSVHTRQGETHLARHLVLGVGALHYAKFPNVPGRESFQGVQLHSAAWDESVDLTGKRVVVVGTGASAIQVVPALAPKVKQLTLFQRTPAWVLPRNDAPIGGFWKWLFATMPWVMKLVRARIYVRNESRASAFKDAQWLMRIGAWLGRRHLKRQVKNPALHEALTPKYAMGCKRTLVSDDYYPAFNRENVTLEASAVAEVTPTGVKTPDGRHVECDAIVWCTGFDIARPLTQMKVTGRGGKDLATDAWKDGVQAWRGTFVSGFPNMSILMGPNTGLGHNSMVYMIESQIHFVMQHLRALDARGATTVEVKPEAQRRFNEELQAKMPGTVWASGCTSWYLDEKGRNSFLWPGATYAYRRLTREVAQGDVEFSGQASAPLEAAVPQARAG
jgi:cation diffusion facilitator CzcD-associated flavoprotein CzcO